MQLLTCLGLIVCLGGAVGCARSHTLAYRDPAARQPAPRGSLTVTLEGELARSTEWAFHGGPIQIFRPLELQIGQALQSYATETLGNSFASVELHADHADEGGAPAGCWRLRITDIDFNVTWFQRVAELQVDVTLSAPDGSTQLDERYVSSGYGRLMTLNSSNFTRHVSSSTEVALQQAWLWIANDVAAARTRWEADRPP